ncbi:hypothetical protein [Shimia sediminis]|uniref:hypothetical protein n=1 Tax=Shimia sediminis TaxID=2497945 RepID=UPI000F8DA175|nr:hypothetical protein [Shimia sediminis]
MQQLPLPHDGNEKVRNYAMSHKPDDDNRANQLNPNNDAYWESRGEDGRPDDWETRIELEE